CFATTLPFTSLVLSSLKVTVALPLSLTLIVLIGGSGLASLFAPSSACFSGSVNLSVLSTLTSLPGFSSYLSASCFATTLPCTSPVLSSLKVTVALPLSSTLIVLIGSSGLASLIAPSTACFSGSVNLSVLSTLTSLPGFSSYL